MPTYTLNAGRPDDGTFEVGTGPFPDLPAGDFSGNFYGNDPRLGRIQAGDQRYSLLSNQEADVASSGNTFQVGTGPQPGLPSGVFRPDEVQGFLRDQQRAKVAADRDAAAAARIPVNPTPIAGPAVPAQTTLPSPVAPVAVPRLVPAPSFVPAQNIGVNNLLAIGAAQAPGAIGPTGVPGIVSPLQSLLPPPSTVPATGSNALAVPNISSSIPASVFSQLFPSIPDISQTTPATAAHGGPILASDSLPGYQSGTEVDFVEGEMGSPFAEETELEARRPKILSLLRKYLGEESEFPGLGDKSTSELQGMLDNLRKAMPESMVELLERGDDPLQPRSMSPFTETPLGKPMDPNDPLLSGENRDLFYAMHDREPFFDTELMMRLQEPGGNEEYARQENLRRAIVQGQEADLKRFRTPNYKSPLGRPDLLPGELQGVAHGGPILASEYLNAGGPVQYFSNGGGAHEETEMVVEEEDDPLTELMLNYQPPIGPSQQPTATQGQPTLLSEEDLQDPIMNALTNPIPIPFTNRTLPVSVVDLATLLNPIQPINAMVALGRVSTAVGNRAAGIPNTGITGGIVDFIANALDIQPGDITIEDPNLTLNEDPNPPDPNDITLALPGLSTSTQ